MSWMEKLTGVALPEELASNTIVFNDGQGRELVFEFLDLVRWRGQNYAILVPEEETDDSGEVVILRVSGEAGEEVYCQLQDEQTLLAVYAIFKNRFKDTFHFS